MKIISKFAIKLAAIMLYIVPVAAAAQDSAPQRVAVTQVSQEYAVEYEAPIKKVVLVQPAMGLALPPEEAEILTTNSCLVGPLSTTQGLYDWAEKKGVTLCSPKFWGEVDKYIGKESTIAFRVARVADGYEHCPNMKVVNLGNNRDSCRTYPFNPAHNNAGQVGKYGDSNWSLGGDSTETQALVALGTTAVAGPFTAFVAGKSAPKCGRNCNSGPSIVNINDVDAAAQAISESSLVLEQVGAGGVGPCSTCGTTRTPSANPANPNHSQNGPGN